MYPFLAKAALATMFAATTLGLSATAAIAAPSTEAAAAKPAQSASELSADTRQWTYMASYGRWEQCQYARTFYEPAWPTTCWHNSFRGGYDLYVLM